MRQPIYVRERTRCTVENFGHLLGLTDETEILDCVVGLVNRGVLGTGEITGDEDTETFGYGDYYFKWVGVAICHGIVIVVYPKYMAERPDPERMARIVRAVRKYRDENAHMRSPDGDEEEYDDPLALALRLLDLYAEHGEYTRDMRVLTVNGPGGVSWGRTVEWFQPFDADGAPVYFDLVTVETARDEGDWVTRLHRCLLTECSRWLRESGLDELLSVPVVDLSGDRVLDFGEPEAIDYRLEREMSVQFVTWKRDVIDLIRRLVMARDMPARRADVECLGTGSFAHVWEAMCKHVLGDQLGVRMDRLGLNLYGKWMSLSGKTLLEVIPRPHWHDPQGQPRGQVNTLRPDIVSILEDNSERYLCIYDAKYYTPRMNEKTVTGTPGVESITKQFLYQEVYRSLVEDYGFRRVINVFLAPIASDSAPEYLGYVDFPEVFPPHLPTGSTTFADGIEMWALPADRLIHLYLNDANAGQQFMRMVLANEETLEEQRRETLLAKHTALFTLIAHLRQNPSELESAIMCIACPDTGRTWTSPVGHALSIDPPAIANEFHRDLTDRLRIPDADTITLDAADLWNNGDYEKSIEEFNAVDLTVTVETTRR